jgi:hypothetical protein
LRRQLQSRASSSLRPTPLGAYYPASAELFHAIGIVALRNDFLSALLNLGWMALALLAAWCAGRRWELQWLTLATDALLLSLPVLGTTQPGEAFNDIVGLASLMAALALLLTVERGRLELFATAVVLVAAAARRRLPELSRAVVAAGAIVGAVVLLAAGDVVQRHYFHRRYLVGAQGTSGLGTISRWAQPIVHARIALYGTVEQYPLYGATDTNVVDYLGQPTPHGGDPPLLEPERSRADGDPSPQRRRLGVSDRPRPTPEWLLVSA